MPQLFGALIGTGSFLTAKYKPVTKKYYSEKRQCYGNLTEHQMSLYYAGRDGESMWLLRPQGIFRRDIPKS